MSYLLTEIALEMLGYKFYDINGRPGDTNFQNNAVRTPPNSNEHEQTLDGILEEWRLMETSEHNTISQLIQKEVAKIRYAVMRKKDTFHTNEVRKVKHAGMSEKDLMALHIASQRESLTSAADGIVELRKSIEHRAKILPAAKYQNYLHTFSGYQNSVKRDENLETKKLN